MIGKKYLDIINKSVFNKILIYIILPVLIVFFINIYINIYYSDQLKKNVIEQHNKTLDIVSNSVNQSLQQVLTTSNLLTLNASVTNMMYSSDSKAPEDITSTYLVLDTIQKYKNTSEFISSAAIVDRGKKIVVSDSGKATMQYYFADGDTYENYDLSFWSNLVIPRSGYDILAPTKKVLTNKTVIPLVASGFLDIKSQNILIVDIDCQAISKVFLKTGLPKQGNMYIFDPTTNISIGSTENASEKVLFDNAKFVQLLENKQSFSFRLGGKKYLIIKSPDGKGIFNRFLYVSIIPMDVLLSDFNYSILFTFGISILAMLLIMLLAYRLSKGLYIPIQRMKNQLIGTVVNPELGKQDELEFINKQLQVVIDMNKSMKYQLQAALPLVCEQYLYVLLNSEDDIIDGDVDKFLNKNGVVFDEDYFIVATIRLKYTEKFYEEFNHDQYIDVNSNLYSLFQMVFLSVHTSFLISSRKDSFILIINCRTNDKCFDNVIEVLTNTVTAFETDKEFIRVNVGVGNVYSGYEGMRQSFKESQNVSILQMNSAKSDLVVYSGGKQDVSGQYSYAIDDENKLFNSMIKGDIEGVGSVIREIVDKNFKNGINQLGIKFLYQQIYNTAVKVLQAKGLTENSLMQEKFINVNVVIDTIDSEQLVEYINQFVYETVSFSKLSTSKVDMKGIVEYIDENYQADIYLESIAQEFNTSSKYLSRMIKNHLGISFGEYLARLRIEKAKKLLTETNLPINDIVEKAGFNSRNTFIRTFKKYAGVVPSEYRNIFVEKMNFDDNDIRVNDFR